MGSTQQVVVVRGCCLQRGWLVVVMVVVVMQVVVMQVVVREMQEEVHLHSWTGSVAGVWSSLACCRPHRQLR